MKLSRTIGIGILSLLLGVPAAVLAQEEPKPDEPKAEPKQEQPKPESKQDEMKAPKQEQKQDRKQEQKEEKQQQKEQKQEPANANPATPENNNSRRGQPAAAPQGAQPQSQPSRAQAARPAGGGGHIPDDQFRAHFGRSHTVVINQPVVVEGQPRFQYGGYWFVIADPWPGDWAYTDQCYIDYVDGEYFLFDLLHPGVRIALFVAM